MRVYCLVGERDGIHNNSKGRIRQGKILKVTKSEVGAEGN